METTYDIVLGSEPVGTAFVEQKGLYYEILCSCALTGQVPFRIQMHTSDTEIDLGLCYKRGEKFGLKTHIAVKRSGQGPLFFAAVPHKQYIEKIFIPIRPEEPFAYLKRLGDAYLIYRNGKPGISFKNLTQDQQDNDPSP